MSPAGTVDAVTDLWLVRHGDAVPESVDASRPLSDEGIRSVTEAAALLAGRMGKPDLAASSGKLRARQTAGIIAAAAGYPPGMIVETAALSPGATPEAFTSFLEGYEDMKIVLCVGHLPSISVIASFFLSTGNSVRIVFGAGSACHIRLSSIGRGNGELVLLP